MKKLVSKSQMMGLLMVGTWFLFFKVGMFAFREWFGYPGGSDWWLALHFSTMILMILSACCAGYWWGELWDEFEIERKE